jgi:outer membrane receptor for ferrienterochelin and colicin
MKPVLLLLYTSFCVSVWAQSPSAQLSGYIYDASSGEALIGATIFLPSTGKGIASDNYGRFSIPLKAKTPQQIQVSYVGYAAIDTTINIAQSTSLDFYLKITSLDEVQVVAKAGTLQHNAVQIPVERLKAIPMLLGQPDLIKALAFVPGVSTGVEGTTGLYVRGGTPDQNLILLDGATVYNAAHLFGFQSVFDPSAIKDIKLIKGGFPARYGGRLSSILDITMKEGNNQERHGEFTLGLVNSGLMLEGPVNKGRSSYMVSGRAAYLGLLLLPTALGWKKQDDRPFNTLVSYDFNFKFNHQFKNKDKLFVSAYLGNDNFLTRFRYDSTFYFTDLSWGNKTASLRYIHAFNSKIYSQTMLNFNTFQSRELNEREDQLTGLRGSFIKKSAIEEASLKQIFFIDLHQNVRLSTGVELLHQKFSPSSISLSDEAYNLDSLAKNALVFRPTTIAAFAQAEWDPTRWMKINAGLRYSDYEVEGVFRHFWEPRLNIDLKQGRFSYNLSYAVTSQFVHLLANNAQGLFSDLWVPSTKNIAPQWAEQYSAGVIYKLPSLKWEFSLEAFYKNLYNQIDYRQGINFFDINNFDWQNTVASNGLGRAKGLEMMVKHETESLNGWVSYTLSENERRFENINFGEWYPFRYDRRHNLAVNLVKKLPKRWTLGANFVYQTGSWATLETAIMRAENTYHQGLAFGDNISVGSSPIVTRRNNQQLPDYHRLDLALTRSYQAKKGKGSSQMSISVYNTYARKNPYSVFIASRGNWGGDAELSENIVRVTTRALFSVVPSIAYTKKW